MQLTLVKIAKERLQNGNITPPLTNQISAFVTTSIFCGCTIPGL